MNCENINDTERTEKDIQWARKPALSPLASSDDLGNEMLSPIAMGNAQLRAQAVAESASLDMSEEVINPRWANRLGGPEILDSSLNSHINFSSSDTMLESSDMTTQSTDFDQKSVHSTDFDASFTGSESGRQHMDNAFEKTAPFYKNRTPDMSP